MLANVCRGLSMQQSVNFSGKLAGMQKISGDCQYQALGHRQNLVVCSPPPHNRTHTHHTHSHTHTHTHIFASFAQLKLKVAAVLDDLKFVQLQGPYETAARSTTSAALPNALPQRSTRRAARSSSAAHAATSRYGGASLNAVSPVHVSYFCGRLRISFRNLEDSVWTVMDADAGSMNVASHVGSSVWLGPGLHSKIL